MSRNNNIKQRRQQQNQSVDRVDRKIQRKMKAEQRMTANNDDDYSTIPPIKTLRSHLLNDIDDEDEYY